MKKLHFTSFTHARRKIASRTSANLPCHTNNSHQATHHLSCISLRQPLPRKTCLPAHVTRTFLTKLIFTSRALTQTNIASQISSSITCHTNIPEESALHFLHSRTSQECLVNLNPHHMPHEQSSKNSSSPLLLPHERTSSREPQPRSHAERSFLTKLLFTSFPHERANLASQSSTNMTS